MKYITLAAQYWDNSPTWGKIAIIAIALISVWVFLQWESEYDAEQARKEEDEYYQ